MADPYDAPARHETPTPSRRLPAWAWGLAASFVTLAVVTAVGFVGVFIVNPSHGDEFERGRRIGEGAARLCVVVGVTTGLIVRARRRRSDS